MLQRPTKLKDVLFDFLWDLEKLHSLDLPTQIIPTELLLWHLDLPYWKYNNRPFHITPRQVWESPKKYNEQYGRTIETDLNYPIIVRYSGKKVLIVDGVHRLLKAVINGVPEITVAIFSENHIPLILHEE